MSSVTNTFKLLGGRHRRRSRSRSRRRSRSRSRHHRRRSRRRSRSRSRRHRRRSRRRSRSRSRRRRRHRMNGGMGYNARLSHSLAARHGPASAHMQSYAQRRHESEAMEKRRKRRKYSGNRSSAQGKVVGAG